MINDNVAMTQLKPYDLLYTAVCGQWRAQIECVIRQPNRIDLGTLQLTSYHVSELLTQRGHCATRRKPRWTAK
eukprot:3200683-Prymnesium_polylepis.1